MIFRQTFYKNISSWKDSYNSAFLWKQKRTVEASPRNFQELIVMTRLFTKPEVNCMFHTEFCREFYPRTPQTPRTPRTPRTLQTTSREDVLVSSKWALPWKTTPRPEPHTPPRPSPGHDNICIIRARTNSPKRHEKINISDGKIIPPTRPPNCATQYYRKIIPDVSNYLRNIIGTLRQKRGSSSVPACILKCQKYLR